MTSSGNRTTLSHGDYEKGTPVAESLYREVRAVLEGFWSNSDDDSRASFARALRHLDALYALGRSDLGEYLS